jgi:hypothetical protein
MGFARGCHTVSALLRVATAAALAVGISCAGVSAKAQSDSCYDFILEYRFGNDTGYRSLANRYFNGLDKTYAAQGRRPTDLNSRSILQNNLGNSRSELCRPGGAGDTFDMLCKPFSAMKAIRAACSSTLPPHSFAMAVQMVWMGVAGQSMRILK